MIFYMRKRDKEMVRVVLEIDGIITLRYEDVQRMHRSGDWWVTKDQFLRLYIPWIDTDDTGDDYRGEGE